MYTTILSLCLLCHVNYTTTYKNLNLFSFAYLLYLKIVSKSIIDIFISFIHYFYIFQKYGLDEPYEIIYGHKMNFRRLMSRKLLLI